MPFRHFFSSHDNDIQMMQEFLREEAGAGPWSPPTDVIETEDGVIVRLEVAGCVHESLAISIMGKCLQVRGVRRECCRRQKKAYRQMEIHYGAFEKRVPLPCAVKQGGAQAQYRDGMLEVFLPRALRSTQRILLVDLRLPPSEEGES